MNRMWMILCALLAVAGCSDDAADADDASTADAPEVTPPVGYMPDADPQALGPLSVGVTSRQIDHTGIDGQPRPLDLVIWYPTEADGDVDPDLGAIVEAPLAEGAPFPTIAFSHGQGAEPNQSRYQVAHLASHGFVVIAPGHPGSLFSECMFSCAPNFPVSAANRPAEIVAAVDAIIAEALSAGGPLHGAVDEARMGVIGHSFGGYTTLGVMGGDSRDRFQAGVAMAPVANAGPTANITAPFMVMAAELDATVRMPSPRGTYEALTTDPRYYLWFANGGHYAYNDICVAGCSTPDALDQDLAHELVNTYATAFLQVHVGGAEPSELLEADADIADGEARLEVGELTF